jgi:Putative binding domain, N-terminal
LKIQSPRRSGKSPDGRSLCAAFFIFTLFCPGLLVSPAYAGNAGSFLLAYPLPVPTKQYQVIETTYPLPAPEGYSLAISATPGEFTPATFVLRAGEALSGVNVQASALTGPGTIPAGNVDVRLVKTWYQASTGDCSCDVGTFLIPELLLKDDALINTDRVAQISYLRATVNGTQQYVDITTVGATVPAGAIAQDAATLQTFSMAVNTNKQVWLTVQVPTGTPAGAYTGTITVSATGKPDTTLSLSVTVLPFILSPSLIEQSIFYRGLLEASCSTLDSECKTQAQMSAEFVDMRDHGIRYPTIYDGVMSPLLDTRLSLMESAGFPKDKIYQFGDSLTAIGAYDQTVIATAVTQWNSFASARGWGQVYDFALDEVTGTTFDSELTAFQTIHTNGGKVLAAIPDTTTAVRQPSISQVDTVILYGYFATASDVAATRALIPSGGKVFMYGGPFTDMENPEYVRKHYGFALLLKDYDGAMNYAYQDSRGSSGWNDFTRAATGNRVFAWTYPTSNGVVDTLQWEGYREAVDDIRYASTLAGLKGWTKAQLVSYLQGLSTLAQNPDASNFDSTATRQTIINEILATGGGCTYAINPGAASADASSSTGSVSVSAGTTCAWTSSANASWLGVMSGSSGSGNSMVSYSVAANSGAARTSTLTVAGQTFTVTQAATCTYALSATSASAAAGGGSGAFNVTAAAGCAWTSQSNTAWITVVSGGSGNGTVSYSVSPNTGAARSGTLTVAGQTFTINQAAGAVTCTNSLSPTSANVAAGGATGSINVGSSCAWTAISNTSWITVTGGASGSGNGSVSYSVATNSGVARSGTLTIAGQTFTINQHRGHGPI